MREAILWIHRWLGLTAGLIFGIASATGAVLVYQAELETLLGGPRFETTEGELTPAAIETAVLSANPNASITEVEWPGDGENVVRVGLLQDGRARNVWVDNGSGRLVEPRRQTLVLLGIRRLHTTLLMGRYGAKIVTWASAAGVVAIIIGIYLWWPGIRKFWTGFRVRSSRGAYILNFDLHQALGILGAPLLLLGAATGFLLPYGRVLDKVEKTVHAPVVDATWTELRSAAPPDSAARPSPLARLVTNAKDRAPQASLRNITVSRDPSGVVKAELTAADGAITHVAMDRYSGDVLATRLERVQLRFDRRTNHGLHVAEIGGPVFALIYMLSCVIGFVLVPTGVVVWWMKRTRKAESADRRADARVAREAGAPQ